MPNRLASESSPYLLQHAGNPVDWLPWGAEAFARARAEGKPENIIAKMIEGRLRNFFSQCVLLEQPFVKDDKQTVGQLAAAAGLQIKRMENWKLGS